MTFEPGSKLAPSKGGGKSALVIGKAAVGLAEVFLGSASV